MSKAATRLRWKQINARALAVSILLECRRHNRFVQEILDEHLERTSLAPPDRRLVTQLVYGVQRRRLTLDRLLRPFITRPLHRVEPWIWETLRIGAYQLVLLTHIPLHAAIHETVELASLANKPGCKAFLNAVLRRLAEVVSDDFSALPSASAVPWENGQYRLLKQPLLPSPEEKPLEYFAVGFAFPPWLVARWAERYDRAELYRLGFWFNTPPPAYLRVNILKTTREAVLERLRASGIAAEPGQHPQSIRLEHHASPHDLPGFKEGWFLPQDESSMQVVSALAPQPGWQVLDLCAAPGAKTTHLAELMQNQGKILACDIDKRRLAAVPRLAERLGVTIIETHLLPRLGEPPTGPFDAILADVPCSNTGVFNRRPEARWKLSPRTLRHLVPLQTKLLIFAAERVRPGGAIVYSTCSLEPEENRTVVQNVLQVIHDLRLEAEVEQVPGQPSDGGYYARIVRRQL
ncbi:MAG: 16S rRNA (cytosine(967)-C(5))-methyltransferase RsmB [Gemmatales bacterium]|nr:16S rRNA (cytosine(967)-C(5))-methyltransferase RsmB [Gemmatales bacterium]MDW8223788.1 16S rRNA (cytosine(967)-C(5))-methyltransferase RsmB [Gemmatales bacterium]